MNILQNPWPNPALPAVGHAFPTLRLRASNGELSIDPASAQRMYVCGITPYDATHLGHAATYLTFDLINRYVRMAGGTMDFVENITDIDEPLLERATRDGVDWQGLAEQETNLFKNDMSALRLFSPEWFVPATQVMELVDQAIAAISARGFTYVVDGDIYFRVTPFLSDLPIPVEEALAVFAERGGDPDRIGKEHPLDPVLWIAHRSEGPSSSEPGWNSSHGFGRPGWHIECAVISLRYLVGEGFLSSDPSRSALIDLQGGGRDLEFPHHFMSAAQVKAMVGQDFARGYVHAGLIGLDGEKMSKSKGNLVFVSKLLAEGVDPVVIRYALLQEHYSTDRMWSDEVLHEATSQVARIRAALSRNEVAPSDELVAKIIAALANDLDTPTAFNALLDWVAATESGQVGGSTGQVSRLLDAALGLAL